VSFTPSPRVGNILFKVVIAMRMVLTTALLALVFLSSWGTPPRLVLYPQGLALVEETRSFELESEGTLVVENLPQGILLESLVIEGVTVLSLSPTVSAPDPQARLEGQYVEVVSPAGTFHGRVISAGDDRISLATDSGFVFIRDYQVLRVPYPPRRAVEVRYLAESPGPSSITLRYLARGISWRTHYRATLGGEELELVGVAELINETGLSFSGATVELIAGEVYTPAPEAGAYEVRALVAAPSAEVAPAGEYHRYSLPEPVELGPGTLLVPLVSATLPYEQAYRFQGGAVETVIRFRNSVLPLPAGEISFYEEEGRLLVGAASIGHTPVGEEVELAIGAAFDLTGERIHVSGVRLGDDFYRDTYRIVIRSAKEEPVEVEVLEYLTGSWTITWSSLPYQAVDAHRVLFRLSVPAGGEAEVSYTVEWSHR